MEKLLSPEQVCEMLQVKRSTIYSWVFTRKIPFVKLNGVLRFKEKAINKWVEGQAEEIKEF